MPGIGIDCVGVPAIVAARYGVQVYDPHDYSDDTRGDDFLNELRKAYDEIEISNLQVGDIAVFWVRIKGTAQHCGVVTERGFVHVSVGADKVIESNWNDKWKKHLCAAFRFKGIT